MTNTNFTDELKRIADIQAAVLASLSGQDQKTCLGQDPTRKYSIGILSPLPNDITGSSSSTKRRPNALGFEVIIENANKFTLDINIDFAVYWRSLPTWDEQRQYMNFADNESPKQEGDTTLVQKYLREEVHIGPINIGLATPLSGEINTNQIRTTINQELQKIVEKVRADGSCWPKVAESKTEIKIPYSALSDQPTYEAYLAKHFSDKETPVWAAGVTFKSWPAKEGCTRMAILINNATQESESKHPNALHSCSLSARLSGSRFASEPFAASFADYRYKTQSWGKGINSVLVVSEDATLAKSETAPEYRQPRTMTRSEMDANCRFTTLASNEWRSSLAEIEKWLEGYAKDWTNDNTKWGNDPTYSKRKADLADFMEEIARFRQGIAALEEDPNLALAFKLANQSFAKGKHPGWRLFQLVFVVTQMTSLLARESSDEGLRKILERVDVLWFPTGGGKTEAYFGVITAALFYDRLRGKSRGTTAWLRYPLRMLSIQQLQRLMDIVVAAEGLRNSASIPALLRGDPFTLGYYVGEKNTPNNLTYKGRYGDAPDKPLWDWKRKIEKAESLADIPLLVLQRCSHCGSDNLDIEINVKEVRIKHKCKDCSREMPIYISDSEIYRYAPSIVVGTVDRLARAGQKSHFAHIFGLFTHQCPDHGYLSGGECAEKAVCTRKSKDFLELEPLADPTPALLLQDELHLLKESLGTYDSHYETFLDTLSSKIGKGLPTKRLAATATIEGYTTHIRELYQREAVRFPVKGMEEFDSAYVAKSVTDPTARIYVGIMPTGSGVEEIVTNVLQAINTYSATAAKSNEDDSADGLAINYDLALAYVNQKNAAGNIRSNWVDHHEVQVLTGDKGLAEVRSTIARIESDQNRPFEERLKALIATSIISHGVDLERLNLMAFAGFPNSAADYIQASSRVGRSHLGIVFTVFRPEDNRERNIYQRFLEYHERLYQLVQPVPINRLSQPAIQRTLPGILSASILNILGSEYAQKHGKSFDRASNFIKALADGEVTDEMLIELVKTSIGIKNARIPKGSLEMLDNLITEQVIKQRAQIERNEEPTVYGRMRPNPVSSLREVGTQLIVALNDGSAKKASLLLEGRL